MTHGVGREARCRIGMAIAALNRCHRNVRRRGHAGGGGAVVTARAIGIGGRVSKLAARPARESRCRAGVTGNAIGAIGRDVASE